MSFVGPVLLLCHVIACGYRDDLLVFLHVYVHVRVDPPRIYSALRTAYILLRAAPFSVQSIKNNVPRCSVLVS